MTKLFISQPMNGKNEEDILKAREKAIELARNYCSDDIEVLDSYFPDYNTENEHYPLKYLSKSIGLLAEADAAYFSDGWENARGCKIEHECAVQYGIKIIT